MLPLGQFVEDTQQVDAGEDVAPAVGGSVPTLLRSHRHRQHRCNSVTAAPLHPVVLVCGTMCVCVGLQFYVHMYAYMPTHCLTCSHIHTHTHAHTHTCMHCLTCSHTHTHTCTHTHTHACTSTLKIQDYTKHKEDGIMNTHPGH